MAVRADELADLIHQENKSVAWPFGIQVLPDPLGEVLHGEREIVLGIVDPFLRGFLALAQGLLEYETLTGDDIRRVVKGEAPLDDDEDDTPDQGNAPSVTAIPKTKPKPKSDGGLEPEPSA